jgi:predicted transcriptional regulator
LIAFVKIRDYDCGMGHPKKPKPSKPSLRSEEDAETLAAIDRGLRDVEAGRVLPEEEVRKLIEKWTSTSSIPKRR